MFGVIGDRIGHRDLLAMMRATYAVLAAVLMTLALTGHLTPPLVFVIAAMMGIVRPSDGELCDRLDGRLDLAPPGRRRPRRAAADFCGRALVLERSAVGSDAGS